VARWVSASTYIEETASGMIFTQRWECAISARRAQQEAALHVAFQL
jgi:hypothetical protein